MRMKGTQTSVGEQEQQGGGGLLLSRGNMG